MYEIVYHSDVARNDIPQLDTQAKRRIKQAIEKKLTTEPDLYGKPLRKPYVGYFKLRVGDYRIVFKIKKDKVFILGILHRKQVYDKLVARL